MQHTTRNLSGKRPAGGHPVGCRVCPLHRPSLSVHRVCRGYRADRSNLSDHIERSEEEESVKSANLRTRSPTMQIMVDALAKNQTGRDMLNSRK